MRISRREFGVVGAAACGTALAAAAGSKVVNGAGGESVGQAKVNATIMFKGLLGIAATNAWESAKVLLMDASKSSQRLSLPFHLPALSIEYKGINGVPPSPDDDTGTHWVWYLSKKRVTFEGVDSGKLKWDNKMGCPMTPDKWRDPQFIADARKINNRAGGVVDRLLITDDTADFRDLAKTCVSTQIVLPNGHLAGHEPSRQKLRNAWFKFSDYGHISPITDAFELKVDESTNITIVLTSLFDRSMVKIPLAQETFNMQITNRIPKGGHATGSHFVALYDFAGNPTVRPTYTARKCNSEEEIPESDWDDVTPDEKKKPEPDDPIYCPPIRVYNS